MVDNLANRPRITGLGKIQIRFGEAHEHSFQLSRAVSIESKSCTGIVSLFCHRFSFLEVAVCGPNLRPVIDTVVKDHIACLCLRQIGVQAMEPLCFRCQLHRRWWVATP